MCQMCDECENELVRMGLIEDAKKFREEREREHAKAAAAGERTATETRGVGKPDRVRSSSVVECLDQESRWA